MCALPPIRLIDIPATLRSHGGVCFVDPRKEAAIGWNFHVISHTWSKRVRELSDVVGKCIITPISSSSLQEATHHCSSSSYNELFLHQDFSREPAYIELIIFFTLLSKDQVLWVWFDALCINQQDEDNEKRDEVRNMGSYYSNSQGCYALIHGVGNGYHLWSSSGRNSALIDTIPRWFKRAWTFQEFIYPKQMYFLVAPSVWTIRLLNRRIEAQGLQAIGFCRCCLLPLHVYRENSPSPSSILYNSCGLNSITSPVDFLLSQEEGVVVMEGAAGAICSVCGSPPLIRSTPDHKNLYFVERDAYIFVASLERWMPPPGCIYMLPSVPFRLAEYDRLIDLYKVHLNGCDINYSQIVEQVSFRGCSVSEDRILCILGILGINGLEQTREKQPLRTRLIEVAKICKADTLIRLSIVEYYGNHAEHMSWAPRLTGHSLMLRKLKLTRPIQIEAEVLGVSKRGYLRIESTVLHGWFKLGVPIFTATDVFAEITNETKRGSGTVSLAINCCSAGGTMSKIGAVQVPLLRFTDLQREALQFPLWMIVLGHSIDWLMEKTGIIAMVCLGKDKYKGGGRGSRLVLHKVGLVIFPDKLANTLISMCGCKRKCILSGFGRILNDYVFGI